MNIHKKLDKIDHVLGIDSKTGKKGKLKGTLVTLVKQACGAIAPDVEIEYEGVLLDFIQNPHASNDIEIL
jgi:hypothetical protein